MDANIMDTKLKFKVDEISSSTTSAAKIINELNISVSFFEEGRRHRYKQNWLPCKEVKVQ